MIAVYAGSFDPVTRGHMSVAQQACSLFERVICLVAVHPTKRGLFTVEERLALLRGATASFARVECTSYAGMVVDFARDVGATALVRGIRGASDAEYENQLAQANRQLAPEINTIYLPADAALSQISSSELKRAVLAGEQVSAYCPRCVELTLRAKLIGQSHRDSPIKSSAMLTLSAASAREQTGSIPESSQRNTSRI